MAKKNDDKYVLELNTSNNPNTEIPESDEDIKSKMLRGFNNKEICFTYPFAWQDITEQQEEDEFTNAVLFNKTNNSIVKISTQPCLVNNIEEFKKLIEDDLKSKECTVQQSAIEKLGEYEIWDVFYTTKEGLEIEQFSILKENNLYALELYTKNNRDPVVIKPFVELIQSFKVLKPSYKVDGNSYEKL